MEWVLYGLVCVGDGEGGGGSDLGGGTEPMRPPESEEGDGPPPDTRPEEPAASGTLDSASSARTAAASLAFCGSARRRCRRSMPTRNVRSWDADVVCCERPRRSARSVRREERISFDT